VPDHVHANVVAPQLGQLRLCEVHTQIEQQRNLGGIAFPVLGREAVDGHHRDAPVAGGARHFAQCHDAATMAFDRRHPALARPAAVAVHDDRDVSGQLVRIERDVARRVQHRGH
jgi:hypothetical protein